MTLTSAATVTLDNFQYTVQIQSVRAELSLLPGVDYVVMEIAAGVDVDATPGVDAVVELDGGDGAATIITGVVDRIDRDRRSTRVTVTGGGAALARTTPAETYDGLLAMQIVTKLAEAADVDTGLIIAPLMTAAYVGDPRRTAAQHIAKLAELSGALAAIDSGGALTVMPWPVLPTVAMRRDREFLSLSASTSTPSPEVALVGSGGAGVAMAPDAWLQSVDALTSADDPDATRRWQAEPVLRAANDVDSANDAESTRRAAATMTLDADCWLQPARRPGDVVQIQEVDDPSHAGPWLITRVRHTLTRERATTQLVGVTAGDTDGLLGGLLGGLSGALGGF